MLRSLKQAIETNLDDATLLTIKYVHRFGRFPNRKNPSTFNEHILCYKLSSRGDANFVPMVDKIEARQIVAEKVGADHIIPTYWHGDALPSRSERRWPKPYVLKSSHGWNQNIFVRSDRDEHWDEIEAKAQQWLGHVHGTADREWMFAELQPRLLVEQYIGSGDVLPVDYKILVFRGSAKMIQVHTGRATDHRVDLFDRQWKRFDFDYIYPRSEHGVPPPKTLARMIEMAEKLGEGFPFVRCDFYEVNDCVYCGGFTFFPEAGMGRFSSREADLTVGAMWK